MRLLTDNGVMTIDRDRGGQSRKKRVTGASSGGGVFRRGSGLGSSWSVSGRVPAILNGIQVEIIIKFDNDYPYGVVCGARTLYEDEAADMMPKGLLSIEAGDTIDFLCDFYTYSETYQDSYFLGEAMVADGELTVSNVQIGGSNYLVTYRLTDIYNNTYWTPAVTWEEP